MIARKARGPKLGFLTRDGSKGTYVFIKTPEGAYHALLEVETKAALRDCGAKGSGNTREIARRFLKS